MYGLTAAHKTMKFGTRLSVTNPDNNRSVTVTVNDRGPFIAGRDLDLSYGAAKAIGLTEKGVGRVKIEFLGRDTRYVKRIAFTPSKTPISGGVTIQVGSFTEESRAYRLKQGLEIRYKDVYISTAYIKGTKYYRVQIGKYSNYGSAYSVATKLAEEGYSTFITSR
jgi:rare lipoprotein A